MTVFALSVRAGSLEPPGLPAPTMHDLDEIYDKVDQVHQLVSGGVTTTTTTIWTGAGFTDNGDGTITETSTGLMWAQNANFPGQGYEYWISYYYARDHCNTLELGGYTDWRMPTHNELTGVCQSMQTAGYPTPFFNLDTQSHVCWAADVPGEGTRTKGGTCLPGMNFCPVESPCYNVWPVRGP